MKLVCVAVCCFLLINNYVICGPDEKLLQMSKTWADRLGADLWMWGVSITRKDTFFERYNKSAYTAPKDGTALTQSIEQRIRDMMAQKVSAVERIMDAASNLAASAKGDPDPKFPYYNAKNLTDSPEPKEEDSTENPHAENIKIDPLSMDDELPQSDDNYADDETLPEVPDKIMKVSDGTEEAESAQASQQESHVPLVDKTWLNLTENPNFFNIPVNMEHSAVHVPSNVYDKSDEVMGGIIWSEKLDSIFVENYRADPTLSWQYFGSGTGFMRQFPAMIWHQEPVDAFDCRTRAWYIEAASSPKDIVILVDRSGSMTGMQKEIAKHVVNNILDTLGNNDYVNIFTFSNITEPLVPCFNDTLVQANLANVRELKENMDSFTTENIANFSDSLTVAFKLLENYRIGSRNKSGAGCNQAIMLITDGVQYNYKELFEAYNWRDLPYKPVRVFTYLIGREVSDVREVKWMACANQGYYVQLSTFAEVREQVLHYIPVMARPMVLLGAKPQATWSPVYADVTDPKLTNWLWMQRQRRDQRERFLAQRKHGGPKHNTDQDKRWVHQQKKPQDHYGDLQSYTLMTSVSMPVYDRRQNATRVANLLGVAGTDVPIQYIQQLMKPHLVGVNGYAFIITNNGYVLIHPDLRPVFQGILKPAYNRVDMVEVELPDDDLEPREFNRTLLEMRREAVFQRNDKKTLDMKYHLDDMKRVMRGRRHFYYRGIEKTPFTLVVALPENYGHTKIVRNQNEDIYLQTTHKNVDVTKFFVGNKWRIHPEWEYCKDMSGARYNSSEEKLLEFLKKALRERIKWSDKYAPCDRELVTSLVYEAKCSDFFNKNLSTMEEKKGQEVIRKVGFTIAFIATQSGLTRWQDFPQNIKPEEGVHKSHFSEIHNTAIDEVWYRRAVEQHSITEDSFVYSVPIDVGEQKNIVVTASHAVFLKKAPIAVVGHQFYHDNLIEFFNNVTANKCSSSNNISCYIVDNNAYVVLSTVDPEETGRWLGDIEYGLLKLLVDDTDTPVFRKIQMYDYQAVCFPVKEEPSCASYIMTPFRYLTNFFHLTITTVLYFLHLISAAEIESTSEYSTIVSNQPPTKQNEKEFDKAILINKTKPTPCDERRWLYELVHYKNLISSPYNKAMNKERPYIVQKIQYSNLVLLIVKKGLKFEEEFYMETPYPEEIDYNMTLACRIREDDFPRRRYAKCVNRHANESSIELCGRSSYLSIPTKYLLIFVSIIPALLLTIE